MGFILIAKTDWNNRGGGGILDYRTHHPLAAIQRAEGLTSLWTRCAALLFNACWLNDGLSPPSYFRGLWPFRFTHWGMGRHQQGTRFLGLFYFFGPSEQYMPCHSFLGGGVSPLLAPFPAIVPLPILGYSPAPSRAPGTCV